MIGQKALTCILGYKEALLFNAPWQGRLRLAEYAVGACII